MSTTISVNGGPAVDMETMSAALRLLRSEREFKVWADVGATAWLNAAIAQSKGASRPAIDRTVAVEFFRTGVQFVCTDGHMLFRTWAPYSDIGDLPADPPVFWKRPKDSVVVMDPDGFALSFMRMLLGASSSDPKPELMIAIEFAPERPDEPPLGEVLSEYVLTLRALGQQLSCRLLDGQFPEWRALQLGVDHTELVEELVIGTKLFKAVGQLRGVGGVTLSFSGEERAVRFEGNSESNFVAGLLMPMRKREKKDEEPKADEQLEHDAP